MNFLILWLRIDERRRPLEEYLEHLASGLGHADRHEGLRGYCTGLMLPLARKSVQPMPAQNFCRIPD